MDRIEHRDGLRVVDRDRNVRVGIAPAARNTPPVGDVEVQMGEDGLRLHDAVNAAVVEGVGAGEQVVLIAVRLHDEAAEDPLQTILEQLAVEAQLARPHLVIVDEVGRAHGQRREVAALGELVRIIGVADDRRHVDGIAQPRRKLARQQRVMRLYARGIAEAVGIADREPRRADHAGLVEQRAAARVVGVVNAAATLRYQEGGAQRDAEGVVGRQVIDLVTAGRGAGLRADAAGISGHRLHAAFRIEDGDFRGSFQVLLAMARRQDQVDILGRLPAQLDLAHGRLAAAGVADDAVFPA